MLGVLVAAGSLLALAWSSAATNPPRRVPRREGRGRLDEAAIKRAVARAAGPAVDCCDARSDDWKEAGEVYQRWRPSLPLTFPAAYAQCFGESVDAAERGDYSKPADRRCSLGKMHAHKRAEWAACRRECGQRSDDGVLVYDDGGTTAYSVPGLSWSVTVRPDAGGRWVVARLVDGTERVLARSSSFKAADRRARGFLLDVPF